MKHEDLLEGVRSLISDIPADYGQYDLLNALEAVINLHKPEEGWGTNFCGVCYGISEEDNFHPYPRKYPCPTIQAIEKELG